MHFIRSARFRRTVCVHRSPQTVSNDLFTTHEPRTKRSRPDSPGARRRPAAGVRAAAVTGALAAAVLARLGRAPYPAQFVLTTAASCGLLAVLIRPKQTSPLDWLIVRTLLALNLIAFGISYADRLSAAVAAITILLGLSLLAMIIRSEATRRAKRRSR